MAPASQPIRSSSSDEPEPEPEPEHDEIAELDKEPVPPRPRLSLPLKDIEEEDDDDDASPDIPPPRLSLQFDEDEITSRSIELPRRERPTQDQAVLSRRSFGDIRLSENFGDLSNMEGSEGAGDNTVMQGDDYEEEADTTGQPLFDAG